MAEVQTGYSVNGSAHVNNEGYVSAPQSVERSEKKKRNQKKDENVLYIPVEDEEEPIHIRIKRLIPRIIDEYVTAYKKPIRRNKLQDLVFSYDEKLAKFYEEQKEAAVAVFSFALSSLYKEKKVVKVKDPEKKKPTYYILPKHVDMFRKGELSS